MTVQIQRPLRGSRISSFYPIKNLPSLASLDSAFQLQEYISLLIRLDVHDVDTIVSLPAKKDEQGETERLTDKDAGKVKEKDDDEKERKAGGTDIAVDEACWIYEQLRRLAQDLSHPLITTLQQECTRASCPEMKAGEWLYLCVAHGTEGAMEQCCAIDYILHTVDSATALLNSPRAFPSRLQIPTTSHRHFSSLARRLGRIFAHAYFHHREAFEQAEVESSLYARFLALTARFDLVPPEFLVIPPMRPIEDPGRGGDRGRGEDREGRSERERDMEVQPPRLLGAALRKGERSEDVDSDALRRKENDSEQEREDGKKDYSEWGQWTNAVSIERAKSHSPPGLGKGKGDLNRSGSESPRKIGRNRTDTMVLSDATTFAERVAEDLAKTAREHTTRRETELEEVAPPPTPTPSGSEAGETGGLKEPAPTLAYDSDAESSSETSPAESTTELQPKPHLEPDSEPEPVPMVDDQPSSSTPEDSNATKALAEPAIQEALPPTSDDSEPQIPPEDAEPAPHTAGAAEPEVESSSSAVEPVDGSEHDKEPMPDSKAEEAATGSESRTDRPEAVDGEKPTVVSEAETEGSEGGAAETDAVPAVADDDDEAMNTGEGKDDGDDFVPVDKAEVPANTDGDSEETEEEQKEAVETLAEEKEELMQGKTPEEVLAAVGGGVEKAD